MESFHLKQKYVAVHRSHQGIISRCRKEKNQKNKEKKKEGSKIILRRKEGLIDNTNLVLEMQESKINAEYAQQFESDTGTVIFQLKLFRRKDPS